MGAGFHGGFSGTKGSAPIHFSNDIKYDKNKISGYLLNENHTFGKAKFFKEVLGYTQADSKLLYKNVVSSIKDKIPSKTEITSYGLKHIYKVTLQGKSGASIKANVVVVIQKDKKASHYKIVTIYPD